MTREEELDWLCRLRSEIYVYMPREWLIPMKDALDMAIKALEQEPCEDAVSRQAVLDELRSMRMVSRKKSEDAIKTINTMMFSIELGNGGNPIPIGTIDDIKETLIFAHSSICKLQKIEQIINDPLIKAFGSISTNKIREILGEEDKTCQMQ